MDTQRLLHTLAELRAEVARAESLDPETAEALESAMHDLQAELDKRGAKAPAEIDPVSSGFKEALLKFEAEHPQLSGAVGKVADALAAMGI